jgi:hypothetical protein
LLFPENLGISQGMPDDPQKTRERIENLLRKALTLTQKLPQHESVQEAVAPYDPAASHYRVARYPASRFYALYDGDELLAVTVYKKGAVAIRDRSRRKRHGLPRSRGGRKTKSRLTRRRLVRSHGSKKSGDQEKPASVKPRVLRHTSTSRMATRISMTAQSRHVHGLATASQRMRGP